jgi:hypothetical protein
VIKAHTQQPAITQEEEDKTAEYEALQQAARLLPTCRSIPETESDSRRFVLGGCNAGWLQ